MNVDPLVSVIIPTYNRRRFLAEALESVFAQTYSQLEVIVADDGSTDDTVAWVTSLGRDDVTVLRLEHQGRPAPARNAAIRAASGEFLAFLDSDDQWRPEKVAVQVGAFRDDPELLLVATDSCLFPAARLTPTLKLSEIRTVEFRDMLRHNPIANSSVMIRRSVVESVGLLDEAEQLRGLEDYDYWLRIVRTGRSVILPEPLLLYRRHEGNIGVQDIEQIDRQKLIIEAHRSWDPDEIDAVLDELQERKAFRRAFMNLEAGESSVWSVLRARELGWTDRLRLARYGLQKRLGRS